MARRLGVKVGSRDGRRAVWYRDLRAAALHMTLAGVFIVWATPARSQHRPVRSYPTAGHAVAGQPAGSGGTHLPVSAASRPAAGVPQESLAERPAWQLALASALLPGTGQVARGQLRGGIYLLAEALIWVGFDRARTRGRNSRAAYRRLAWEVARGEAGAPEDGGFAYYERLSQWERSGVFDTDPAQAGIQPETDPTTFNGDAWRLAVSLFLGGQPGLPGTPGYDAALAYYSERAYGGAFLWDWTLTAGSWGAYQTLIRESDSYFEQASLILGGALLNRVVSAADAYLSAAAGRPASLRLEQGSVGAPFHAGYPANPTHFLVLSVRTP